MDATVISLTITYLIVFGSAALISFGLTPAIRTIAPRLGALDFPNQRKVHSKPVPSMGGVAILAAFATATAIGVWLQPPLARILDGKLGGILIGCLILAAIGIYDDIRGMRAYSKLAGQLAASAVLVCYGFTISKFTSPLSKTGSIAVPAAVGVLLTVLWVVGLTNAINLIDGLDGLAAGIVFIVSITMLLVSIYRGDFEVGLLSVALGGAVLGFLRYNFYPASIFMGDTGSMCLGFILAAMSLLGASKSTIAVALLVPISSMAVPLIDTSLAFLRRVFHGQHPFKSDRQHLHHRLLALGLSQKQVVFLIHFVTIYLGIIAFITVLIPYTYTFLILIILAMGLVLALKTLAYVEKHIAAIRTKATPPNVQAGAGQTQEKSDSEPTA